METNAIQLLDNAVKKYIREGDMGPRREAARAGAARRRAPSPARARPPRPP